jgi:hypothetical protein
MRSRAPQYVSFVLAVLAFAVIVYIAAPSDAIKQATGLFGSG